MLLQLYVTSVIKYRQKLRYFGAWSLNFKENLRMSSEIEKLLDETGWRLLVELQENARISFTELGERVGLTSPAVAERVRRMEEAGIITGYHAHIDYAKVGLPVMAMIQLAEIGGVSCATAAAEVEKMPEVVECIRTTGDDSMVLKVAAASIEHLTQVLDKISRFGIPDTAIMRPNPMIRTAIGPDVVREQGQV
jgi:Lrp/AsnC family leucine-responsive transcriptional regulator